MGSEGVGRGKDREGRAGVGMLDDSGEEGEVAWTEREAVTAALQIELESDF